MAAPANSRVESLIPRPTAFKPGVSGNPRGRKPGIQNRRTIEVREVCSRLVDDPIYLGALRRRMINGTAGAMEPLLWHYAHGKPVERVEQGGPKAFAELSNSELKARLAESLASL